VTTLVVSNVFMHKKRETVFVSLFSEVKIVYFLAGAEAAGAVSDFFSTFLTSFLAGAEAADADLAASLAGAEAGD